ncbi:hypothetical protein KKC08_03065 [Patescibacteria group bacterium]|nr:hypothetical protein [Patescibacteria group bacterium]MBU4210055.1 hypothetical protein [Patescibacteria group bacterium]MBU4264910.1 hypothetical protein [Patescibacteria group bacterium]MBU4389659.1 hypothetical protein [Patescibacteria group bacterium]MBU4397119.1 hypothetical protein [Patescibacteria group bacterium]
MAQENKYCWQLTEHEQNRMADDLKIATTISSTLRKSKYIAILDGGYGVDSVIGNKITRFHHDVDFIVLHKTQNINNLRKIIIASLCGIFDEDSWIENNTTNGWLWFTKKDPLAPNLPRQLNIHLIRFLQDHSSEGFLKVASRKGKEYRIDITQSLITDTIGNKHEFFTLIPEEYVATKLRLIPVYASDWRIRDCDQHDLRLLFQFQEFDIEKCISILNFYYQVVCGGDQNNARGCSPKELFTQLITKYPSVLLNAQVNAVNNLLGT